MKRKSGGNVSSILITGGAGFVGSHLAERLLSLNYRVTVIDNLSTGRRENITGIENNPNFNFIADSAANEEVMADLAKESDVIVHLAATVGVKLVIDDPAKAINNNIETTNVVLKAARHNQCKVLILSTSEVYSKGNALPFKEEDSLVIGPPLFDRWSYAASKLLTEFLALSFYRKENVPVVVIRLFNTVGPRQVGEYGMVVPRLIKQALLGEPLTVYGDGSQTRCFLHVNDTVDALVALIESPAAVGQIFNVGSTHEISILELAQKIITILSSQFAGKERSKVIFVPYKQVYGNYFEDMYRRLPDISKMKEVVGWTPKLSLEDTLRDIINSTGILN